MNRGYIKLWRKVLNHKFFQEKRKFSRFEAWFYIIMMANGKDKEIIFDGKSLLIKRGQFLTSQRQLAARWGWSKTKTADFLKISSKHDHAIEIISDRKKSIITILNYEKYNPLPRDKKTTEFELKKTTERPQKDQRLAPTNKDKRKNNKENRLLSPKKFSDVDIHLTDLLIEKILRNNPKARVQRITQKTKESWLNECRKLREIDGYSPEDIEAIITWCQEDPFEKTVVLSMTKLRKRFDELWLKSKRDWVEPKGKYKPQTYVGSQQPFGKDDEKYLPQIDKEYKEKLQAYMEEEGIKDEENVDPFVVPSQTEYRIGKLREIKKENRNENI